MVTGTAASPAAEPHLKLTAAEQRQAFAALELS